MLGTIRKFSSSIYAKILLFVVAIPFVFWGMGPVFQGGKVNVIAEIGKDKISTQEFVDFLQYNNPSGEILDKNSIEKLLSTFIGTKLIAQEIKNLCRNRFSSYKVPNHIEFWKSIPKTPSKKLLRRKVRELINKT